MSIIRVSHSKENPYVIINKKALWDKNLSLEAVGLWARLLSRPDNWQIDVLELCRSCDCGETKMYRLVNELIDNGYAYRYQLKGRGSKFTGCEYVIFETKKTLEEIQIILPLHAFPDADDPDAENPEAVSPMKNDPLLSNKEQISKKEHIEREREPAPAPKKPFGKFVKLEEKEHAELVTKFGEPTIERYIQKINDHLESTGKKPYKGYAATIRNWIDRDKDRTPIVQPGASKGYSYAQPVDRRQRDHLGNIPPNPLEGVF